MEATYSVLDLHAPIVVTPAFSKKAQYIIHVIPKILVDSHYAIILHNGSQCSNMMTLTCLEHHQHVVA